MRAIDGNFYNALISARETGIIPRTFVWFIAKTIASGAPVTLGLWTGDDDINVSVTSGTTGLPEARTYYGAMNLDTGDTPRVSDMTAQTISLEMSQIADIAQQLVRGYDLRLAKVEIHEMTINPSTGALSATPSIAFLGQVDGAPIDTPSIGQDGKITVNVISDAISMLNRTNPQKSSYEGQKRRSNDQFGKYSSTVKNWSIPWGQKSK
ncbi:hypothetical protein GR212_15310 [Rhizobium lusitanum]|uniref:DUF2163 domain-containing protein n=1 Tax=Rhizobium lusitanum TaxID=293958 RepID=A0A6L9U638_9HYPH|nr:hypothetical protein [Rhizobium lusitanum]NEI70951.1 hypothetical protein [Rhizobium lusitanum]